MVDTFASMVDHTFADPISCFINRAPTLQYCGHTSASFPSSIDSSNYGQRRQPLRPSLMRISISNRFGPSDLARRASERQQSNGSTREYFANTATANIFTGVSNINAPLRRRMVYRHFTTAIDRRNMETVFEAMRDSLLATL
ncbi:unnamed protein product [Protopolystoma xenopodis]|uniref:Uncharacterized protein n=1 Tax=Protopolystoma xenopodis TaxID=117903 RepID=A0A448WFH2_9PLAT|nr:unnamed protein product [Protopolystoma xenopodis]